MIYSIYRRLDNLELIDYDTQTESIRVDIGFGPTDISQLVRGYKEQEKDLPISRKTMADILDIVDRIHKEEPTTNIEFTTNEDLDFTANFDPNQPRDKDGKWSNGSSDIELSDHGENEITKGSRINFLTKDERHKNLISLGADPSALSELDQLFDYHRHGESSQAYADKKIFEELHKDSPLGKTIRAQIELEERLFNKLESTKDNWVDFHENQSKKEMKDAWDYGWSPKNGDAYSSWEEQWETENKYEFDKMRKPARFYRKGGANKDVLPTSLNPQGAKSHSVTGSTQPHFRPDHDWSAEELRAQGYRILGGYAFNQMGYSGESEITWIKFDKQPTTNSVRTFEVVNAFCPTGPGGGIDNSCSPKRKGSALSDAEKADLQVYEKLLAKMPLSKSLQLLMDETKTAILKTVKNGSVSKTEFLKYGLEIGMTPAELNELFEETSQVFPPGIDNLVFVEHLGGSTGAKKMRDPKTGKTFVMKKGASAGHLINEDKVNELYRAAGIDVPLSQMYQTADGPVRLTQFIEGGRALKELSGSEYNTAVKKIQKGFALDATLGNWDVVGMHEDNIMISPDGTVYRIDNAGSLTYRAQGGSKGSLWNSNNDELDSMRFSAKNPTAKKIFGGMSDKDLIQSYEKALDSKVAIIDAAKKASVNPDVISTLSVRLDVLQQRHSELVSKNTPQSTNKPSMSKEELLKVFEPISPSSSFNKKIEFLNPNGIVNNTVAYPLHKTLLTNPANDVILDHLKKTLPEGTKLVGIYVWKDTKTKELQVYPKYKSAYEELKKNTLSEYVTQKTSELPIKAIIPGGGKLTEGAFFSEASLTNAPYKDMEYGSLNSKERTAIVKFTGSYSTDIRRVFTTPDVQHSENSKTMAKNIITGLKKLDKYNGRVYRGLTDSTFTKNMIDKVNKSSVGGVWEELAPHSSSRRYEGYPKNRATSKDGVLMVMKTKSGRLVEDISQHPGEYEVLCLPTKYKIMGIHNNAKVGYNTVRMVVELEELE